jgi:hypothetical protein
MPKTVPADVLTQFALASILPRYLLTIVTTAGVTLRYCDGFSNINFPTSGGDTYTARGFDFNTIKANLTLEVDRVQITIDNVDGGMLAYFGNIQGGRITLALVDLGKLASANNDVYQFAGIAGAPSIDEMKVSFPVLSPLVKLAAAFPNRQLSGPCPWKFDGTQCLHGGSSIKAIETDGVIEAGTTTIKIVDTSHRNEANDYWNVGMIEFTTGALDGIRRQITTSTAAGIVNLIQPLPSVPVTGVHYDIERGCDKTVRSCLKKFNNWTNFGGFKMLPKEK